MVRTAASRSAAVRSFIFALAISSSTTHAVTSPAPIEIVGGGVSGVYCAWRLKQLAMALPSRLRGRLYGVGVAAPLALEGWQTLLGVAPIIAALGSGNLGELDP